MKKPFAKQIILGTMALTLVGGGGYLLKGQDVFAATATTTTDSAKAAVKNQDNRAFGSLRKVNDELIAFLKLEKSAYQEKLASGKTLAEIATEQGISRDALKTELTKEVTASLDKEKADFALNLDKTVDAVQPAGRGFGPDRGHRGGPGGDDRHGGAQIDLTTVATALGYTTADELKTALSADKSIADLATAKGVALQSLINLEVVQIVKDLDQRLADGKITQTEYDQQKADSTTIATHNVNDTHTGQRGFGAFGGRQVKTDLTTVATALGYATAAELKTALVEGTSIADLATAKGVALQSLIDLQAVEITKNLDTNLASGKLTQTEYNKQKADVTAIATRIVNDKHDGKGGPGGRYGKERPDGIKQKTTTPAPTATPAITSGT